MAFIVKKMIHGKEYYYLNENKRVEGKVKTKTIAYLGKTKKEAKQKSEEIIKNMEKAKDKIKNMDKKDINLNNREVKPLPVVGKKIDEIASIASKRGFFFQTASIYGGKAGFFTYGHLGKALKLNWESLWREHILSLDDNFYEIQGNNILPEPVFRASGHIENFNDPLTECKKCHSRFRVDQFLEDNGLENAGTLSIEKMNEEMKKRNLRCMKCGGELSEAKQFNMMFPITLGFNEEKAYLSPETAQAAYLAFKEEFAATRSKLPLGLAIIDKVYRNEISPRQMFFRLREFSQAELQIFFDPAKINEHQKWKEVSEKKLRIKFVSDNEVKEVSCAELNSKFDIPKFYLYYAAKVQEFYISALGIPKEKFRLRELGSDERAFYNKIHFDVEVMLDTIGGFKEIAGVHYRTDHDLVGHSKVSGKNLEVFYDEKKILPHVLELSFGVDRNIWTLLDIFYSVGKEGSMFRFPSNIAPIKATVLPLVKDAEFEKISEEIMDSLKKEWNVFYIEHNTGTARLRHFHGMAYEAETGNICAGIDANLLHNP